MLGGGRVLTFIAVWCFASPVDGARIRRAPKREVVGANAKCDMLTNIVVREHNFGDLAAMVCRAWPPALGAFPINTTGSIVELLELAFAPNGVWDDMKQIWNTRRNRRFCWRNETIRDIVPVESNFKCHMNVSNVCYGHCPRGYKPGALMGRFRPVCTTVCADTFHQVPCGFGCAENRWACAQTLLTQVVVVAQEVAQLMGAITGNPLVSTLVDRILTVAEFALEVLPKILLAVKNVYKYFEAGHKNVAWFLLLFQFVAEVWPEGDTGNNLEKLYEQVGSVMQYVLDLTDGALGSIFDLSFLRDTILKHGDDIMGAITTVTKAFDYPKCGEMERNTIFTLEDTGTQEMVGPWVKWYEVNNRPRYVLASNNNWLMEYSRSLKVWRIMSPRDGWLGRKTMYKAETDASDYPVDGWVSVSGGDPVPKPMPAVFSCNALERMQVNGHGFGSIAGAICHFWPGSLGDFPIQDERRAFDILETAFAEGGLWDQIKDIRSMRQDRPGFCWRTEVAREVVKPGGNCDMEKDGVCYGACPWGFRKSFLIGQFEPVCSSACGESSFSFPCGFGCSSGLNTCLPNIKDQVWEVTRFVGEATSFIFDQTLIGDVVERVTYIAEFLLDVMPVLVEAAKAFWKTVREDEAEVALLVVLLQFIFENSEASGNQEEFEVLRDNIGETIEFIQSVVDANFKMDGIDLGFIQDRIVEYGDKLLGALVTLTKDFLYTRCDPSASEIEFSVDAAGEEKLLGLWILNGTHNDRPQYTLRSDDSFRLVWRDDSWQFRGPKWGVLRKTLYTSSVKSATPPSTGWKAAASSEPNPDIIFMKQQ